MSLTVASLEQAFFSCMNDLLHVAQIKTKTISYYKRQLDKILPRIGRERECGDLVRFDAHRANVRKWHEIQALQRLFNWGVEVELISRNPFSGIKRPPIGCRRRILSRGELARFIVNSGKSLRCFLLAARHSIARPQELRSLRLSHWNDNVGAFFLNDYKARARRRDTSLIRVIPGDHWMRRFVDRRKRILGISDYLLLNSRGEPWTANALRIAVRRAAKRAGLDVSGQEHIVAYSMRHTGATWATAAGIRDRQLADIMGHTTTRTTARYQHLAAEDLVRAIGQATARRPAC